MRLPQRFPNMENVLFFFLLVFLRFFGWSRELFVHIGSIAVSKSYYFNEKLKVKVIAKITLNQGLTNNFTVNQKGFQ